MNANAAAALMQANAGRFAVRELDSGPRKYALDLSKIGCMGYSPFGFKVLDCRESQISFLGNLALCPFQKSARGSALLGCDHVAR